MRDGMSHGSAEKQQQVVWREKEIYGKELAHMTLGAEKSHDAQSASWRLRRAAGAEPM